MRRTDNPLFFQSFVEHCYESHINAEDAYFLYKQACLGEELAANPEMQEGFNEALAKLAASPMDVFDTPARQDITLGGTGAVLGGLAAHALPFIKRIHNPIAQAAAGVLGGGLLGLGASKGITGVTAPLYSGPSVSALRSPRGMQINTPDTPSSSSEPFSLMNALGKGQKTMDGASDTESTGSPIQQRFNAGQERINSLNTKMQELNKSRRGINPSGGLNDQLNYRDLTDQASGLQDQKDSILGSLTSERNHALGDQERGQRALSGALADTNNAISYRAGDAQRMAQRIRENAGDSSPMGFIHRAWDGLTGFNGRAERLNSELESNYNTRRFLQNQYQPALDNYVPPLPN